MERGGVQEIENMIHFDRPTHRYTNDDGVQLASVTEILRGVGIQTFWSDDPQYRDRGRAVHDACRLLDGHDPDYDYDPDATEPDIRGYVQQYALFKRSRNFEALLSEVVVGNSPRREAGTFDKYGRAYDSSRDLHEDWLLDIKTGTPQPSVKYQLAAYYSLALASSQQGRWTPDVPFNPLCKLKSLTLTPDRFKLEDYTDPVHVMDWTCIARIYWILRSLGKLNGRNQ